MIVILEDNDDRQEIMQACLLRLTPNLPFYFFKTASDTIEWLKVRLSETKFIALDHDLEFIGTNTQRLTDPGTGRDVADYLATQTPICRVLIHTTNTPAGIGMEMVLKEARWKTKRILPYGDMEWIPELWFPFLSESLQKKSIPQHDFN